MAKEGDSLKGQLHKGPVTAPLKSVPGYKPVSSIPAKFETILYTGPREKKGFTCESRRFQEFENDLPGPGSYNSTAVPLDRTRSESTGKKGYGPLASQSRRFSNRVYYTGPGPADYRKPPSALQDHSFSVAPVTPAFQDKAVNSVIPLDQTAPNVGPGTYDNSGITRKGARVDYTSRPGATSAFKMASGHELILLGNIEAPPPTSYELGDPWDKSTSAPGRGGSRMGTSSFGTGPGRGGASVGSMAATLDTLLFGAASGPAVKPDSGPGPGSYELQDFSSIRSKLSRQAQRPSPQFLTSEPPSPKVSTRQVLVSSGDKVAHDYLKPSHSPLHTLNPAKGVSAPFRSRSAGHQEIIDQRSYAASANAPGPAYYQPSTVIRSSYHKNAKQQYVTVAF